MILFYFNSFTFQTFGVFFGAHLFIFRCDTAEPRFEIVRRIRPQTAHIPHKLSSLETWYACLLERTNNLVV